MQWVTVTDSVLYAVDSAHNVYAHSLTNATGSWVQVPNVQACATSVDSAGYLWVLPYSQVRGCSHTSCLRCVGAHSWLTAR